MARSEKLYILILEIEPMKVGGLYSGGLHCTVVYWFNSRLGFTKIARAVASVASNHKPVTLNSHKKEYFGGEEDLEVYLVEKTEQLTALHVALLKALANDGSIIYERPEHQNEGWRPHITTQEEKSFPVGSTHISDSIYLIEAKNNDKNADKMIRAKIPIGKHRDIRNSKFEIRDSGVSSNEA